MPNWSYSAPTWVGDGPKRQQSPSRRDLPEELQGDARRAWCRRWNMVLGCAAGKAVAMSLLDLVPGGSDGATSSVHDVVRDARFA